MRRCAAIDVVVRRENGDRLLQAYGGKVTIAWTRNHRSDARRSDVCVAAPRRRDWRLNSACQPRRM